MNEYDGVRDLAYFAPRSLHTLPYTSYIRPETRDKSTPPALSSTAPHTMDDPPDVETLVAGLNANSESARKYAVFKLQGLLADPSFADAFIQGDGLPALRECVLAASGNAQAYALGGLVVLLELDMGWEVVDGEVVEKVSDNWRVWTRRVLSRGKRVTIEEYMR